MYQNYIFDLYGTLVDIHTEEDQLEVWEKTAEFMGFHGAIYQPERLRKEYKRRFEEEAKRVCGQLSTKTGKKIQYEEIDVSKVWVSLYKDQSVEASKELIQATAEIFRISSTQKIELYEGVIELMQLLKENDKKIYLLSNAQRLYTAPEIRYVELESWFDGIFLSSDWEHRKPDPAYYDALCENYGLKKEECIMIGNDLSSDIAGAKAAGMDSLYIDSYHDAKDGAEKAATYAIMDGIFSSAVQLIRTWMQGK